MWSVKSFAGMPLAYETLVLPPMLCRTAAVSDLVPALSKIVPPAWGYKHGLRIQLPVGTQFEECVFVINKREVLYFTWTYIFFLLLQLF